MTEQKKHKSQTIDCVKLQREIRNKMFEASKDKSLQGMVDQIKKELTKNRIWVQLADRERKKQDAVSESVKISKPGDREFQGAAPG